MLISSDQFKSVSPGLKWDRRQKAALFDVRSPSGKRVRRINSFESVEAAKAAFPTFRSEVKAGKYDRAVDNGHATSSDQSDAITLSAYVAEHWESLHAKCSEATIKSNEVKYRHHVAPFFGPENLSSIDEARCEDFALHMKSKTMAAATTNYCLRFVRKVLHHARRRKFIDSVPENFHFVKEGLLHLELTDNEQDRFIDAFDDENGFRKSLRKHSSKGRVVRSAHFGFNERRFGGGIDADGEFAGIYFGRFQRAKRLFIGALDTGYRINDLRLLKRVSVDREKGIITITTAKTGKQATVAMSDRCRKAIETSTADAMANSEFVFTTEEGQPYSLSTINRYFKVAKEVAGITRRCRLNDLRHSFASNLVSDGVPLPVIRDALGHSTTRMTERYAKPNSQALELMRDALNRRHNRVRMDTGMDTQAQK